MNRKHSATIYLRVRPQLKEALKVQAARHDVTVTYVLERLAENWLDDVCPSPTWNARLRDIEGRVERLEDSSAGPVDRADGGKAAVTGAITSPGPLDSD